MLLTPKRTRYTSTYTNDGYTLIEISVVLFVIALVFSISMPRLGSFLFRTDLNDVARSLKATVFFLRSKSISTHTPTVLHLDIDRGLYWGEFAASEERGGPVKSNQALAPPRRLPEGVRFVDASNIHFPKQNSGILSSTFNAKGTLEETVIHLADKNKKWMTIIVNAYTGRFSLYDEYVEVEYERGDR